MDNAKLCLPSYGGFVVLKVWKIVMPSCILAYVTKLDFISFQEALWLIILPIFFFSSSHFHSDVNS